MSTSDSMDYDSMETPEESLESNEIIEKTKISLMRNLVEKQDPSSKEVDDLTLTRFLRARDLDVEKASAMFLKHQKWRRNFVPNGCVSASEVGREIEQNKLFQLGSDKKGQPILVFLAARHFQNKQGVEEFKRFVVYSFDKILARMPAGLEKFVVISDLEGWGYANCDIRGYLAALSLLQDCYPERLAKLFVLNAPYIFMATWKIIYPFIDNKTKNKIVFVENKIQKSTLLEEIDESQLPETYGGKLPLVPIHDS